MTIGERIRQRRLDLGLSADDVAAALGKNRATVYRYESNDIEKLPTTVLEPLAEVLKTTPAYLMGWDTDQEKEVFLVDERAKRISEAIEKSGLSYPELERLTGISKSSLQRYATGVTKKIPIDCIEKIAEATHADARYLMGWEAAAPINKIPFAPAQMIPIPVIGRVAAGYTCLAEQYIDSYALADPDSLTDGYDYFWLRVTGDSMEPDIREGDLVLVRVQEAVESGECAVVLVDGEDGLVKDIEIGKDHVTLCSKNPNYPPRVFVREEANRVRIVGKVVELKRVI